MELVDAVVGKQIDIAFQRRRLHPRAGHVEHHAAVGEPGAVDDRKARDRRSRGDAPAGIDLGREQAEQLLEPVEDAPGRGGADDDAVGRDVEAVGLRGVGGRAVEHEGDGPVARHSFLHGAAEVFGGVAGQRQQRAVGGDGRGGSEAEGARAGRQTAGSGLRRGAEAAEQQRNERKKFHAADEFVSDKDTFFR